MDVRTPKEKTIDALIDRAKDDKQAVQFIVNFLIESYRIEERSAQMQAINYVLKRKKGSDDEQ